jgi:hypothetical protein
MKIPLPLAEVLAVVEMSRQKPNEQAYADMQSSIEEAGAFNRQLRLDSFELALTVGRQSDVVKKLAGVIDTLTAVLDAAQGSVEDSTADTEYDLDELRTRGVRAINAFIDAAHEAGGWKASEVSQLEPVSSAH